MSHVGQHIFISYSRQDGEFVNQLIDDLKKADINVWLDTQRLQVGTADWQRAIRTAIRGAYALVLIVSPDSADSRYVQAELDIARMYECPIYPVWAAGDDNLYGEYVPFELMRAQYADARGIRYMRAAEQLIEALKIHVPAPIAPAPPAATEDLNFTPRNPYKGLRAFTSNAEDVRDYFGREATVKELLDALSDESNGRFLAIVGPSGSGKSSVVMAGLLPKLLDGALPNSESWTYLDPVLPGQQPLEALAVALAGTLNSSISTVMDDLDRSGRGLHLLGRRLAKGRDSRAVLLVDQFEELFTQTMDEDGRRHFINLLVTAATEAEGNLLVLLTLRADFYDRPLNYEGLRKLLETRAKTIGQMNLDELRAVIEEPAKLPDVRLEFEPGLVGDLLFEVREQAGALPLLQFTLDQLAEKRQGQFLTNAAYREMGGVRGALAKHAEATYQKLPSEDHRTMARALFLRLIEPGETEQDTTRRRAAQSELETPDPDKTGLLRQVADAFTNARLLVTGDAAGIATIEVSHEALIRTWERLAEWVKTAREDILFQQLLSRDAYEWRRQGEISEMLYRGKRLADAQTWLQQNVPSDVEQNFIDASEQQGYKEKILEKQRQNTLRRTRTAFFTVFVVGLLVIVVTLVIFNNRLEAQITQTFDAQASLLPLLVDAQLRDNNIPLALESALQAFAGLDRGVFYPSAQVALVNTLGAQPVDRLSAFGLVQFPSEDLDGPNRANARFSRDGRYFAYAEVSDDCENATCRSVVIWDVEHNRILNDSIKVNSDPSWLNWSEDKNRLLIAETTPTACDQIICQYQINVVDAETNTIWNFSLEVPVENNLLQISPRWYQEENILTLTLTHAYSEDETLGSVYLIFLRDKGLTSIFSAALESLDYDKASLNDNLFYAVDTPVDCLTGRCETKISIWNLDTEESQIITITLPKGGRYSFPLWGSGKTHLLIQTYRRINPDIIENSAYLVSFSDSTKIVSFIPEENVDQEVSWSPDRTHIYIYSKVRQCEHTECLPKLKRYNVITGSSSEIVLPFIGEQINFYENTVLIGDTLDKCIEENCNTKWLYLDSETGELLGEYENEIASPYGRPKIYRYWNLFPVLVDEYEVCYPDRCKDEMRFWDVSTNSYLKFTFPTLLYESEHQRGNFDIGGSPNKETKFTYIITISDGFPYLINLPSTFKNERIVPLYTSLPMYIPIEFFVLPNIREGITIYKSIDCVTLCLEKADYWDNSGNLFQLNAVKYIKTNPDGTVLTSGFKNSIFYIWPQSESFNAAALTSDSIIAVHDEELGETEFSLVSDSPNFAIHTEITGTLIDAAWSVEKKQLVTVTTIPEKFGVQIQLWDQYGQLLLEREVPFYSFENITYGWDSSLDNIFVITSGEIQRIPTEITALIEIANEYQIDLNKP